MRAKLPPAQIEPPNELPPPLFSGFLDLLKRRGFAVGVDRHLRLVSLLERIGGECRPEQLKQHVAPLFATNEKEQTQFYRIFEEYFSLLRSPALQEDTGRTGLVTPRIEGKSNSSSRRVLTWGVVVAVIAAIVIFCALFFQPFWFSHPQEQIPNQKTSRPVSPTPAVTARPSIRTPSVTGSPVAQPFSELAPTQSSVTPVLARNRTTLFWIGGLLPLALFAANELRRFSKRRHLVLERTRGRKPPFTWPIHIEPRPLGYLRSEQFYKVARKLRRRQIAEYRRLDVPRTIDATIAASGYPTFQYRPDSRMPEYLILIDRTSSRDHQTALFDQLAQALQREGIFVTRYFFDGDPRVCWSERATASLSLSDLQKIFSEHRLIIFGRGDRLIDPVTGELTEWSAMFLEWHDRAVVTPAAPSGWNRREQTLTERFLVFPATLEGIEQLAERFDSSVPAELGVSDADDPLPPDLERDTDLAKLRSYLGEPVFQLLCACAIYPELHWNLTLLLGSLPALGEHLVTERNMLRLVRIPWFRAGAIPDERRLQLLAALDPVKEVAARAAVVRALEKSPAPEASFAAENRRLEIVLQEGLLGRRSTSELKSALRSLPLDEVTRDYVLLHKTQRISRLAFALPEQARPLFFEKGISALGLNLGARLALTSAVIAATLLAIMFLVPGEDTTGKPIGQPMKYLPTTSSSVVVISKGSEKFIYVAASDQGEVLVMRPTELSRPYAHIPIGTSGNIGERGRPERMLAVKHRQSDWIFVTDTKSNKVHVIDGDSVVGSFSVGLAPRSLAVTPDGRKLFISNEQPVPGGTIEVFDISGPDPDKYVRTATIQNVTCPEGLALSPRGDLLYVATQCGGGVDPVLIIDTATEKIKGSIPDLAVGTSVAVSADGARLYVSRGNYPCKMSNGEDGSPLSIVDTQTNKIMNTVCLHTSVGPIAISRDKDGRYLFVGNGDGMTVFNRNGLDTSDRSLNEIPLGSGVSGIGVAEDNSVYAFVPGKALLFLFNPTGPGKNQSPNQPRQNAAAPIASVPGRSETKSGVTMIPPSKLDRLPQAPQSKSGVLLQRIGKSDIKSVDGAIVFSAGMAIDAGGAPRAYHPDSKSGLDYLSEAGQAGNWWGLVTDNGLPSGKPIIQGIKDPAPGYYVSSTMLQDGSKPRTDPRRYVDSSTVPYIVLPRKFAGGSGAKLGDLCAVYNKQNGNLVFAVYADVGPANKIGLGSIALAEGLGIPSSPKTLGVEQGIVYLIFPGSGGHWPMTSQEINQAGAKLFKEWGGLERLKSASQ